MCVKIYRCYRHVYLQHLFWTIRERSSGRRWERTGSAFGLWDSGFKSLCSAECWVTVEFCFTRILICKVGAVIFSRGKGAFDICALTRVSTPMLCSASLSPPSRLPVTNCCFCSTQPPCSMLRSSVAPSSLSLSRAFAPLFSPRPRYPPNLLSHVLRWVVQAEIFPGHLHYVTNTVPAARFLELSLLGAS